MVQILLGGMELIRNHWKYWIRLNGYDKWGPSRISSWTPFVQPECATFGSNSAELWCWRLWSKKLKLVVFFVLFFLKIKAVVVCIVMQNIYREETKRKQGEREILGTWIPTCTAHNLFFREVITFRPKTTQWTVSVHTSTNSILLLWEACMAVKVVSPCCDG